jgi:putative tryptophan/tyrosine transport system substrate-binding protein
MRRREFITLLGSAALATPVAAQAQRPARIGFLGFGTPAATADRVEGLRAGLRDLGYLEGKNIVIDFRWAEAVDRLRELAAGLVRENVDVIFATSSTEVEAARQVTATIPIVFSTHFDPVGAGHVSSLARPGGNITGLTVIQTDSTGKALEMLTQAAPHVKKIGVLWSPTAPHSPILQAIEVAGVKLGVSLQLTPVRTVEEFAGAFTTMTEQRVDAVFAVASSLTGRGRAAPMLLAELAMKHRLPSMFGYKASVVAGGLMSYSPNFVELTRLAAAYIDKILKGAKPADLPVEQATRFELVINMKTAKALGLTIPPTLLAFANEVIE